MRIALLTPLFPPDNNSSAVYAKTLCTKLPKHQIGLFLYANIPEKVETVTMFPISKKQFLPIRLIHFTYTLLRNVHKYDVLLVQNGPSVELPALITSYLCRIPIILIVSDQCAIRSQFSTYMYLHRILKKRAIAVFSNGTKTSLPPHKPEILPFAPYPEKEMQAYTNTWDKHMHTLETHLQNVT